MEGQARVADECGRVLGRYALHGEIAVGGMAMIHFGRLHGPIGFSRTVAIKRLHQQYARDPEFVSMFLDEARLAARIRHPNVVPTLDVVSTEGELFVVMEYVHGESLSKLIRVEAAKGRRIPPTIVAAVLSGTLQGLHAAHEARDERGQPLSIVHRDVSPHNVLVGADGVARVLDFGIAKAAGRLHTTRQGELKGKLPYMAPEQLLGELTTRQVDVYAASVCLWEALTGRRLFSGNSEGDVLHQVLLGDVSPPSRYCPGITKEIDDVVLRGLSRIPSKRFRTALEMSIALEEAIGRVASPPQVSEWMEHAVGPAMELRRRKVEEIEQLTGRPSSEPVEPLELVEPMPSSTPASTTNTDTAEAEPFDASLAWRTALSQRSRQKRKALVAIAAAFALMVLIVSMTAWQATSTPAAASKGKARPDPPPPASAPVEVVEAPAPMVAPVAAEITSAKNGRTVAPKAPSVAPAVKKACDPPYFFDSSGRKRYKRECF